MKMDKISTLGDSNLCNILLLRVDLLKGNIGLQNTIKRMNNDLQNT